MFTTSPFRFQCHGNTYIAGRVEGRDTEWSTVRFFKQTDPDTYVAALPDIIFQAFQDPFVTTIQDEIILGGVQVISDPLYPQRIVSWHTCFYKGPSPWELKLFAIGPSHMKDIRLCGLADGRVAVFTRPQGKIGGLGKIGFMIFNSLDSVNGERCWEHKSAKHTSCRRSGAAPTMCMCLKTVFSA